MATSKEGMREILRRLRKYLEKKGLTLNTEKTKMLVFEREREGGREGGREKEGRKRMEVG